MKLSVIIVSYNVCYYLEQCLHSVKQALEGVKGDIWVVDNHSSDNSVNYLKERFPDVHIMAGKHNVGFARANNVAICESSGEYVLLLNPDTIVGSNTIRECIDFMDSHPDAGACGVRMQNADGSNARESRRGIPSPMTSLYKMSGLCSRFPKHKKFGHYYMSDLPWDSPGEIEVISGAFCFIRRKTLDKIGLLDTDFFMYGEDIDLSYRILKGGWKNWYLPWPILHYKGESTEKSSFRYVHVFYDAMLIFFRKHYGHLGLLLSLPIKAAIYGKAFVALCQMISQRTRKSLGFFVPSANSNEQFVIYATEKNMECCRNILERNGLSALACHICTDKTPNHLADKSSFDDRFLTNIIYDKSLYSFDDLLDIFHQSQLTHIVTGTFDAGMGCIITPKEVLR